MSDYDQAYYEQRAAKSREMAAAAIDPNIAAIHLEMAERYDLLATSKTEAPKREATLRIATQK
jgi:hypothetical protein